MSAHKTFNFSGDVTEPATINAIIIPVDPSQFLQIKIFAVCAGASPDGGLHRYYIFAHAYRSAGGNVGMIGDVTDIIDDADPSGVIDVNTVAPDKVVVIIYAPFGANSVCHWTLRAEVDFVDGAYYNPA